MNTLMYDALRNAGIKKADARAAAIEAGRNDLRLITFEYAINQMRTEVVSHTDTSTSKLQGQMAELKGQMAELKAYVNTSIATATQKVINTLLIAIGVATAILSVVITLAIYLI